MGATAAFVTLMASPSIPLDEACLLIAAHAPGAPPDAVARGRAALDDLAASCPGTTLDDLRYHLFGTHGFIGNRRQYDDPRNSYLDAVLERRTGIPITLSVIAIEVGRRLGLALVPVGLPGHFVVGVGGDLYLDPFDGGRLLDRAGCEQRVAALGGVAWTDEMLLPVDAHAVVSRVLANLRRLFAEGQDVVNLDWVLELRAAIPGVPAREQAERAAVMAALGRYDEAAGQLERLAHLLPDGGERLRFQAARLRAKLN